MLSIVRIDIRWLVMQGDLGLICKDVEANRMNGQQKRSKKILNIKLINYCFNELFSFFFFPLKSLISPWNKK
jgi:hypothetical protein